MFELLLYYLVGTAWVSYQIAQPSPKETKTKKQIIKSSIQNYLCWHLASCIALTGVWFLGRIFKYVGHILTGGGLDILIFPAKILVIISIWGIILGGLSWFSKK